MKDWLSKEVEGSALRMIALRRDLHTHPELSFEESRTARVIAERLGKAGIAVQTGVAGHGVVGVIHGTKPGKTIAIRADIDALPIDEDNEVPYRSRTKGVMHA